MKREIKNTCGGKRGCEVTVLPTDSRIEPIYSGVYGIGNDISKVLPLAYISLDEVMAQERQMDKTAA